MDNLDDLNKNYSLDSQGEDIDTKKIFNSLKRGKILIASITVLSTFSVYLSSFIRKPVWEGNFQIVVEPRKKSDLLSRENLDYNITSNLIGGGSTTLKNEVAILKSPLVLLPVYEEVKVLREKKGFKTKGMSYGGWIKENLNIDLVRGTNVLNIFYFDYDKEIIRLALNSISKQYQEYSKSDRQRNINQGIKYLNNQISLKSEKSQKSLKELNKFSIENGLGDLDGLLVETQTSNNIRNFDFLDGVDITNLDIPMATNENLSSGAGKRYQNQFRLLENYEAELADISAKLKPNSKILKILQNKVSNLKDYLKRPNEILIEYRTLKRIAQQDEQILSNLENQLGIMRLEQAKIDDPWQLISNPEVIESKKYPNKKKELIISFVASLFAGMVIALTKEKFTGLFYEFYDIDLNIKYPFIGKLYLNSPEYNKQLLRMIFNEKVGNKNEKLAILDLASIFKKEDKNNFSQSFEKNIVELIDLDRNTLDNFNYILFFIKPGTLDKEKIKFIDDFFKFKEEKIIGWIYLDHSEKIPIVKN